LHFRIVCKKGRVAGVRDARGEEHVKSAVVDVLITSIGETFKASEIVYFDSDRNFAAEVRVEMIVVQSAVDDDYDSVWGVTVIVGTVNCEVHTITRLVRTVTFREGSIAPIVGAIPQGRVIQRTTNTTFCLNVLNSKMGREYAMYVRPASGLKVRVRTHDVDSNLRLAKYSEETIRFAINFVPRGC